MSVEEFISVSRRLYSDFHFWAESIIHFSDVVAKMERGGHG